MNLNLLLVIMAVVLICMVMDGYKKGMVKSLISLISLLITCVVLFLIGNGLSSYFDGKIFNVILTILLLAAIGLVHHLLNIVFFSAKMIVKLPIVHSLDKLLGIVVGILETVLIVWTIYTNLQSASGGITMQYKILALDLDGTLTNTDKIITPRTKAALQAAAQRGVCIVLASGRPTVGIEPLAKELELEKYGGCILSYNGGKIIDCKTGETLVQYAFPAQLIEPVCTFSRYWNVVPLTYDRNGIVTEDPASPYVQEEARINRIPVRQVENLPAEVTYPINKLLLTGDPADMPHVEELMQQEFAGKLSICRSQPFFIETMPLGVGKDTSLEILLRAKGLTPANLMACGDGWNDLPMIRLAGLGVAMGNAQAPVKAAADWLTADNDHDGVGLAVEKFILEEN